jgi:protoporphyrin/coproporphyrin ferrochelatase
MGTDAVLLVNLGSPDSPSTPDVRRYLKEFLGDERVIDVPLVRRVIVPLIILNTRPRKSAEAYQTVWTEAGAPLVVTSLEQQKRLREHVDLPVYLAMRYGNPSIPAVLDQIHKEGIRRLFLMPLYPHYAMSSFETVVVRVMEVLKEKAPEIEVDLLQPFYNDPAYIEALYESARSYLEEDFDKLLFSFHGVPERHLRVSDPSHAHCLARPDCCQRAHPAHATCYKHQCLETVRLFTERAGIPPEKYFVSFQSRLGSDPWLQPYTDATLERFGKEGVGRVLVMTPAFITDCLETLEEIAEEGKEIFEEAGGQSFTLIPCLNEHPAWISWMARRAKEWQESLPKH